MKVGKTVLSSIAACGLAVLIFAVLAAADRWRSEEAGYSPLYRATLEGAYSRFRQSDKQVPARGDPEEELAIDPGTPQAVAPRQPGRTRPGSPRQAQTARVKSAPPPPPPVDMAEITQGNQHAAKKEYDKALASFRRHLEKNPTSSLAYHRIADVLKAQGKLDEAVAAYEQALQHNKEYYCVYGHIGDILVEQEKPEEAEKHFARLVAGFREQMQRPGPQGTSAKYQLAKFLVDHRRDLEEAIRLAGETAAEAPDQVSYLFPLLTAYQLVGRKEDAVATIDKIVELKPEFADHYKRMRAKLVSPEKKSE